VVLALGAMTAPAAAQQGVAPAAQGVVVFYRPVDASPAEVQLTVGSLSARLRPGRTLRTTVDAGFAIFGAIAPNGTSSAATIDIVPNVLYAVRVTVRESGEVTLVQVPSLEAEREAAGLQPEGDVAAPSSTPAGGAPPPPSSSMTAPTGTTTATPAAGPSDGRLRAPLAGHELTGRLLLGAHVLGGQVNMGVVGVTGWRVAVDANGVVYRPGKLTLWVGGSFAFATAVPVVQPQHDVQLAAWAMLSFEKFLKIPLVPTVGAGFAVDFVIGDRIPTVYGGGFRFGGGVHYFVTPRIGVGVDMSFLLGGASYPGFVRGCVLTGMSSSCSGFFGTWDLGAGVLFTL
jgi:hypothetical protein